MPSLAASFGPWMWTSLPSKRIWPLSATWVPATHLTSVDLPAPLSPTSAITSPLRTSKSTSVRACTEPNVFVMSRSWRSGVSLMFTAALSYHKSQMEAPGQGASTSFGPATCCAGLLAVLLELAHADLALRDELVPV